MTSKWLLLTFRLPAEPSRKRVAVWRHLRKLGAVYLEEGIWFLPHTEPLEQAIQEVIAEVHKEGGSALAFLAEGLNPAQEEKLRAHFDTAREEEYGEVLRECQKLLGHIQREMDEGQFQFAEVEELEEDFEKVERWLALVQQRDIFGVEVSYRVKKAFQECRDALTHFTQETYERKGEYPGPQ